MYTQDGAIRLCLDAQGDVGQEGVLRINQTCRSIASRPGFRLLVLMGWTREKIRNELGDVSPGAANEQSLVYCRCDGKDWSCIYSTLCFRNFREPDGAFS
jgi:hypothetical protein